MTEVIFTVLSNPVPKPRMTQSDRWAMKKKGSRANLLARYYKWKDAVAWAYKTTKNKTPIFTKCAMGFKFYLVGHPASDLDNFIKGAKDSLTGLAYSDDNGKIVRGYYDDPWIFYVCDSCPDRKPGKADCGKIGLCNRGRAVIKIKSVD